MGGDDVCVVDVGVRGRRVLLEGGSHGRVSLMFSEVGVGECVGTDGGNGFIAEGSARGDCREFRTISAVQECCYIERKEGG